MGHKIMRRVEQPYMENGVEVHAPGDLLELDAPEELGGRLVIVDVPDEPVKPEPVKPKTAGKAGS